MSALVPACGAAAACEGVPWNSNASQSDASVGCMSRSRSKGWNIIAASIPSNTPASIISILPPPPSSAGVPRRTTSPPTPLDNGRRGEEGAGRRRPR